MSDLARVPIIRFYDTLIVSIQVELSDQLVVRLKDDVAAEIERLGPHGLVIDVSGVEIMDSYISRVIRDIGMISRLMGVETVICGLDPSITMTLVEMGMAFEGVKTELNLEAAFESLHGGGMPEVFEAAGTAEEGEWDDAVV